ncbi:MAG: hypothetical protein J0L92_22645 [Deltaproteobacteria bacterium]|nr:hypothetical protein [Deltaproteobacteria bacterium]
MRTLVAVLALFVVLALPETSTARCRPSPGDQLVVLNARAEHGIVLLQRRSAFSERDVITGPTPATLALRQTTGCTRRCTSQARLRELAPNLYAMTIPAVTGAYEITTAGARGTFENAHGFTAATPITTAPTGASIDRQMVGTGFFAPTIVLGAAAPPDAVGLVARWQDASGSSSFFMPVGTDRTRFLLFPGRCRGPLPGYTPPTPGTDLDLAFVDAEGNLGSVGRVTLRDVSLGAGR